MGEDEGIPGKCKKNTRNRVMIILDKSKVLIVIKNNFNAKDTIALKI